MFYTWQKEKNKSLRPFFFRSENSTLIEFAFISAEERFHDENSDVRENSLLY